MIKSIIDDYYDFINMIDEKLPEENTSVASEGYERPMNINEYKIKYGQKISDILMEDPVIKFMAMTGISMIRKEDSLELQKQSMINWNLMTDEMKKKSDQKSMELFGRTNYQRYYDFCKYEFGYNPATEASTTTHQNDPDADDVKNDTQNVDKSEGMSSEEKGRALGHMLAELIDEIFASIENLFGKFIQNTKLLIETDEGFLKNYAIAKKNYEPLPGIEVNVYDYDITKLGSIYKIFKAIMVKYIQELTPMPVDRKFDDNSIFEIADASFEKAIMTELHAPSSIQTLKEFYTVIRNDFRGKKVQKVVRPSDLDSYEKIAVGNAKKLASILTANKQEIYLQVSNIESLSKQITHNKSISDDVRNRLKKYIKRLLKLQRMYNSFLDLFYSLRTEEIISAREVLKLMYKM